MNWMCTGRRRAHHQSTNQCRACARNLRQTRICSYAGRVSRLATRAADCEPHGGPTVTTRGEPYKDLASSRFMRTVAAMLEALSTRGADSLGT